MDRLLLLLCASLVVVWSEDTCQPPPKKAISVFSGIVNDVDNDALTRVENSEDVTASIDWGNLLTPGPASIATMSQLILLTARSDVDLSKGSDKGYVHLTNSGSLRASLMQVANSAYDALNQAHHNMAKIQGKTKMTRKLFRNVVKIVAKGTQQERKSALPTSIKALTKIAPACTKLAVETTEHFTKTAEVINELINACLVTERINADARTQALIDKRIYTLQNESIVEQLKTCEKVVNEAAQAKKKATDALFEQIKDKPTVGQYIGMAFAQMVSKINPTELISCFVPGAQIAKVGGMLLNGIVNKAGQTNNVNSESNTELSPEKMQDIISVVSQVKFAYEQTMRDQFPVLPKVIISFEGGNQSGGEPNFDEILDSFSTAQIKLSELSSDVPRVKMIVTKMTELANEGLRILTEAKKIKSGSITMDKNPYSALKDAAEKLRVSGKGMQIKLNAATGVKGTPPLGRDQMVQGQKNEGLGNQLADNYKTAVASAQKQLDTHISHYEKQLERLDTIQDKSREITEKLMRANYTVMSLNETIEILQEAMIQLANLKESWEKLKMFFQSVERLVTTEWLDNTEYFINMFADFDNGKDPKFGTDVYYTTAFDAARMNLRIHNLAETYVKVSKKHFMPPLQKMAQLLKARTPEAVNTAKNEVAKTLENAEKGIRQVILDDKKLMEDSLDEYREKVHEAFKGLCPNTPFKEIVDDTEEAVQDAEKIKEGASDEEFENAFTFE